MIWLDSELLELRLQGLPRHPEYSGRPVCTRDASRRLSQRVFDHHRLMGREIRGQRHGPDRWLRSLGGKPACVDGKRLSVAQDDGPLDYVLQLAHVPWPAIPFEYIHRFVTDPLNPLAGFLCIPRHEILNQ